MILSRVPYTLETVDQEAHHSYRHFNAWMSNDQACPPVRIVGNRRADIFHEWRTTVNAHPSVSAYFHEWNVYEKIYPRIMRKWTKEAPVSAVSIALFRCETARLIQNGRQLNAMIKSLTVSKSSRV